MHAPVFALRVSVAHNFGKWHFPDRIKCHIEWSEKVIYLEFKDAEFFKTCVTASPKEAYPVDTTMLSKLCLAGAEGVHFTPAGV